MEAIVAGTWYKIARAEGVTLSDCRKISGAFVYPGFSFPLKPSKQPSPANGWTETAHVRFRRLAAKGRSTEGRS